MLDPRYHQPHPECTDHATHLIGAHCHLCLFYHLLERVAQMPTNADLTAALATVSQDVTTGFATLGPQIAAAITAAGAVPQSTLDAVTALGTAFTTGLAAIQATLTPTS